MIGLCGLLLALLLPLFSPMKATLLAGGTFVVVTGLNLFLWQSGLLLPLASTLLMIVALYALSMSWVTSSSRAASASSLNFLVSTSLPSWSTRWRDPERYSMEGRNQELTVLFSDVRSFTTISEGLDPGLTQLMNEYLGAMTTIVRNNRGTLDKYIGDAIMAFWGRRSPMPNMRAMQCARRSTCSVNCAGSMNPSRHAAGRCCTSASVSTPAR